MEKLPCNATSAVVGYELQQAAEQRQSSSSRFVEEHAEAVAMMNTIQAQLHPGLVHPAR